MDDRANLYRLGISLVIAAATVAVFRDVVHYGFMFMDDYGYVLHNHAVNRGITPRGVAWAFTQYYMCNWHPLTWLSHMLDVELFGMKPGMFHLVNLVLHVLNAVLLFCVLEKMTGALWRSAVVAALFAVHPMHVESVVWISERKDVLSALFWFLTLFAYVRYAHARSLKWYGLVLVFFTLGLLAKPMLVTLPFVLLLLDLWPLNRLGVLTRPDPNRGAEAKPGGQGALGKALVPLVFEKIPLFALVVISGGITFVAQQTWGATASAYMIPFSMRVLNALTSYCAYVWKMVWPFGLAIFYPYPASFQALNVTLCVVFLVVMTAGCLVLIRKFPYLATGWLWYLGTLVPVIGIVQVGGQSMADRYSYIPYVGLFILVVWGAAGLLEKVRHATIISWALALAVFAVLVPAARVQVGHWKDDETLVRHAISVTRNNYMAHTQLGTMLLMKRDPDGAIREFETALQTKLISEAYEGLGRAHEMKNDMKRAADYYAQGLQINPRNISLLLGMGTLLARSGDLEGAIGRFSEVIRIDPGDIDATFSLGKAHLQAGRTREAVSFFNRVLQLDPQHAPARSYLEKATQASKGYSDAEEALQTRLKSAPQDVALHVKLGDVYRRARRYDEALASYREALSLQKGNVQALYGMALVHSQRNDYPEAVAAMQEIIRLEPGKPDHSYNLACLFARQGRTEESLTWLKKAIEQGFKDIDLIGRDPDLATVRNTPYVKGLLEKHAAGKPS